MKRTLEFLLIGLVAGGLLTGCPKKDEEAKTEEPVKAETAKQEEPPKAETAAQEPAAEINQENYLAAMYEVSCVRAKVEDTEKQKEIVAEVYPRYGFTEETFVAAQETMKANEAVKVALEKKMEECTPEVALAFAKADGTEPAATDKPATDKPDDKKAPARAWKSGAYNDGSISGGGFENGQLRVNITDEGKVTGSFKGRREGKGFMIPLSGDITKDGSLNASGNKGPNNARLSGRYKDGQVNGKIKGAVNKNGFDVTYTAK